MAKDPQRLTTKQKWRPEVATSKKREKSGDLRFILLAQYIIVAHGLAESINYEILTNSE